MWNDRSQLIGKVLIYKVCLRLQLLVLLTWMKLNTYIIVTNISQQIVNTGNGNGKGIKSNVFYVCVPLSRFQLFSHKEFMFPFLQTLISQPFNRHHWGNAKEMTFRNNKINRYYLSNCLSNKLNNPFQNSKKNVQIGHNSFVVPKLLSTASPKWKL